MNNLKFGFLIGILLSITFFYVKADERQQIDDRSNIEYSILMQDALGNSGPYIKFWFPPKENKAATSEWFDIRSLQNGDKKAPDSIGPYIRFWHKKGA